jgi:hypothetical protein
VPTVADLSATGTGTITWYDQLTGGTAYNSTDALISGNQYYASQTVAGCESLSDFTVTVHLDSLELNLLTATATFCNSSNATAQVIAENGYPSYNYTWENGAESPVITGLSAGDYLVTATDSLGCQAFLVVSIICNERPIPGFVSVGGSGSGSSGNSTWVTNLTPEAEVQIFNRWGNLIFKACPYLDDFIGKSNQGVNLGDDYLPSGTYFYIIDYKNGEEPLSGYIEFVR